MMHIMHMSARAVEPSAAPERRPIAAVVTTDDRTMEAIGQQFEKAFVAGKPSVRPPSPTWLFSEARSEAFRLSTTGAATGATEKAGHDTLFDLFARVVAASDA